MQDYYSRYLPQMYLAVFIPLLILIAVFPINWAAGIILLATAPLIPLFMALVGMGAADANRRNFVALARLSGNFLDRLRGTDTLRLFDRAQAETAQIAKSSEDFRGRTMEVLRLAFLSSGVLEFFASISIAVVAVYFGFSYLGELNFGSYGLGVTLFSGFLVLILAPEFSNRCAISAPSTMPKRRRSARRKRWKPSSAPKASRWAAARGNCPPINR